MDEKPTAPVSELTVGQVSLNTVENKAFPSKELVVVLIIVALLGVGSGYMVAKSGGKVPSVSIGKRGKAGVPKGTVVGSKDFKTFRDTTEGVLERGGINGEGQYHLVRPGGESQYVYLTSSIVDLGKFQGLKIKVWGETQKAQKAGWLMDVGRVEVLE